MNNIEKLRSTEDKLIPFIIKAALITRFIGHHGIYYPLPDHPAKQIPYAHWEYGDFEFGLFYFYGGKVNLNFSVPKHMSLLIEFAANIGKTVTYAYSNFAPSDWYICPGNGHYRLEIQSSVKNYASVEISEHPKAELTFKDSSWAIVGEWTETIRLQYDMLVSKYENEKISQQLKNASKVEKILAGKQPLNFLDKIK